MKKEKIKIIYEDDDLVLVNKPPRILTLPDRYAPEKFNLYSFLLKKYKAIRIVHRLDKETSGIICFARNEQSHKALNQQFESRIVRKTYLTLLDGNVHKKEGIIEGAIAPHPSKAGRMIISKKGKASLTHYKVLEYFKHFTLVEAEIKTGRMHQIRVHFESIGYPLAIDAVYGRRNAFLLSEIKGKRYRLSENQVEKPLMTRSILHAYSLQFEHPMKLETMTFQADLHNDFNAVLKQLRKWGK